MSAGPSRRRLLLVLVALVLAGSFGGGEARACSCAGPPEPVGELRTSDAVFSGKVTSIERNRPAPGSAAPLGRVTFEVREVWKGAPDGSIVVYGQGDEISCGVEFEELETYLVYASGPDEGAGPLRTSHCDATKPLRDASADLQTLGPPLEAPSEAGELVPTGGPPVLVLAAPLLLLTAGSAVMLLLRRHARA